MNLQKALSNVRTKDPKSVSKIIIACVVTLALGIVFGVVAKAVDNISILGELGTRLGIWIVIATLIAAYSPSATTAAIKTFIFFAAMLSAYYLYTLMFHDFFPRQYAIAWGVFAILSPIAGFVVWYGKGNGWIAAICSAFPVALVIAESYSFYYTLSPVSGISLLGGIALIAFIPRGWKQKIISLGLSIVFAVVISQLHILSILFGGL